MKLTWTFRWWLLRALYKILEFHCQNYVRWPSVWAPNINFYFWSSKFSFLPVVPISVRTTDKKFWRIFEAMYRIYVLIYNLPYLKKFKIWPIYGFLTSGDLLWPRDAFFDDLTSRESFWYTIYPLSMKFEIWPWMTPNLKFYPKRIFLNQKNSGVLLIILTYSF